MVKGGEKNCEYGRVSFDFASFPGITKDNRKWNSPLGDMFSARLGHPPTKLFL